MTQKKYLAFDLEIVKSLPEDASNWREFRPLGISCAATFITGDTKPALFYHGQFDPEPLPGAMTKFELKNLVDFVYRAYTNGIIPLTWNGLQFDFDVLAEESGMYEECIELAMNHVDMMQHFHCVKGFFLSLQSAAKGADLAGKTEGMSGALAPEMWAGTLQDREKVLEYVGQDVITTLEVAEHCEKQKYLGWVAQSLRYNTLRLPNGWLTVMDALKLYKPNTSWMDNPTSRERLYQWITDYESAA